MIFFLSPSSVLAEVVFKEVSGAECATQQESENSAIDVMLGFVNEKKVRWMEPLKVVTTEVNGKKVTTIVFRAALPGKSLPIIPQIQKQKEDAASLGVKPFQISLKDKAEIRRITKQHELTCPNH